jgi:hypothetical protein
VRKNEVIETTIRFLHPPLGPNDLGDVITLAAPETASARVKIMHGPDDDLDWEINIFPALERLHQCHDDSVR